MKERRIDFTDHECIECGRACANRRSVGNHINRAHAMSLKEYVLKHYFGNVPPKCVCGCGLTVNWHRTQYYFCDFLSGHNEAGFSSMNQPVWTQEMIDRRNVAIRKAYENDELKDRIATSVKRSLSTPEARRLISDAQKKNWSNESFRRVATDSRKRVWSEQYDELCRKIFTEEFGRKISAANMRRDMKRTSKEELSFVERLKSIPGILNIAPGFWINDPDERSACFDAIADVDGQRTLLEWDGTFYHGLDRDRGFCLTQIVHMANDFRKNRIAKKAGLPIVRIPGDTGLDELKTVADIFAACRYHQTADGTVTKDDMFKFTDDDQPIITREYIIRQNEKSIFADAKGREYTNDVVLPALRLFLRELVSARGWFYPRQADTIDKALESVERHTYDPTGDISSLTSAGSNFLKQNFASFWNVSGGPRESFFNDNELDAVLRYRLGLNNSKPYEYELSDGTSVRCHETFDITPSTIRRGFIVQRKSVSWFKPTAAFEIYKRFLGDNTNPVVWDPSCGFGARLLGFAAAYPSGTYIGTDPATQTFNDLCNLRDKLSHARPELTCDLRKQGSEIGLSGIGAQSVDLVFSSIPYFDREKYFDEQSQCWKAFPDEQQWVTCYLLPTLLEAHRILRVGAYMVINIDDKNAQHVIDGAKQVGFEEAQHLRLSIGRDHFAKHAQGASVKRQKFEPVLVFKA